MRLLRASGYRTMPWANGGGVTDEVAMSPPGADIADLDWRVSVADIARPGDFSSLPAIDRTLMVIGEESLNLSLNGEQVVVRPLQSRRFRGEDVVACHSIAGSVRVLNVMTRRTGYRADVYVHPASARIHVAPYETVVVLVVAGRCYVDELGDSALNPLDALELTESVDLHGGGSFVEVHLIPTNA